MRRRNEEEREGDEGRKAEREEGEEVVLGASVPWSKRCGRERKGERRESREGGRRGKEMREGETGKKRREKDSKGESRERESEGERWERG